MRLAFSVARVSSVSSRSCVQRLQFSCSCVERFLLASVSSVFHLLVRWAFSVLACRTFSVARVSRVFVTPLFAVARLAENAFNLRCLEVLPFAYSRLFSLSYFALLLFSASVHYRLFKVCLILHCFSLVSVYYRLLMICLFYSLAI